MKKFFIVVVIFLLGIIPVIAQNSNDRFISQPEAIAYCRQVNKYIDPKDQIGCQEFSPDGVTEQELATICQRANQLVNGLNLDCSFTDSQVFNADCYKQSFLDSGVDCSSKLWLNSCSNLSDSQKNVLQDQCNGVFNSSTCSCDTSKPKASSSGNSTSSNLFTDISNNLFFKTNFDGSISDLSELSRLIFIVFFMIIAIVAVFIGVYGMYLYSNAGENDEQLQLAQKVFRNALMGLAISILGVLVVSLLFIFLGVDPKDLFTFNISG